MEKEQKKAQKQQWNILRKIRDLSKAVGFAWGDTASENNIRSAMDKYEGRNNVSNEDYLEKCQQLYEQCVVTLGEMSQATVGAGLNLAIDLGKANQMIEAKRL